MSLGLFGLIFAHFGFCTSYQAASRTKQSIFLEKYMPDEIRFLYGLGLQRCARVTVER